MAASVDSSEMPSVDILVLNLFVHEVCSPNFDAIVVDGQEFGVRVVVEGDLVGSVSSHRVSAEGLASGDLLEYEQPLINAYLPDHQGVVVLSAQRGQVLLVVGEGEALDEHLVQFESLDHLESVEVPDDDVRL